MEKRRDKRNLTVEFMRFVFCIIIILYHSNNRLDIAMSAPFSFFKNGKIGVEFFFIVSGWLMAESAKKYRGQDLVKATRAFLSGKLLSVIFYHLFIFAVCFTATAVLTLGEEAEVYIGRLISTLPNLFLLQRTGLKTVEVMTSEWYIAAMLWMMLLLFPLIIKYGERFTKLLCPLITILLIGYMIHVNGKLGGTGRFLFSHRIPKVYVRAFAEMCAGVFCCHISEYISRLRLKKSERIILSGIEAICYLLPVLYSVSLWEETYEAYCFYSFCIAVTLSFSNATYLKKLFDTRISALLGKASLPLYMAQSVGFTLFKYSNTLHGLRIRYALLFFITTTVIFAAVSFFVNKKALRYFTKRKYGGIIVF